MHLVPRRGTCRLFLCLLTVTPATLRAADIAAVVQSTHGDSQGQEPGSVPGPLHESQPLAPGTKLRTGPDGGVTLALSNGSLVDIQPDTAVMLSSYPRQTTIKQSVVLLLGRVWSHIKASPDKQSNYEVVTTNSVASVMGTEFETAVAPDGTVRVRVTEGVVKVTSPTNDATLHAGEETTADEHGVVKPKAAVAQVNWADWRRERAARLAGASKVISALLNTNALNTARLIEKLSRQHDALVQQRLALTAAATPDAAKVAAVDKELATVHDAIADNYDRATAQFSTAKYLPEAARQTGTKASATTLATLKKISDRQAGVLALVRNATVAPKGAEAAKLPTMDSPAAHQNAPASQVTTDLLAHLSGNEAQLNTAFQKASQLGDIIMANCVKELLLNVQNLGSNAQGLATQADNAAASSDKDTATSAKVQLSLLVHESDSVAKKAAACKGGKDLNMAVAKKGDGTGEGGVMSNGSGTEAMAAAEPAPAAPSSAPSGAADASSLEVIITADTIGPTAEGSDFGGNNSSNHPIVNTQTSVQRPPLASPY